MSIHRSTLRFAFALVLALPFEASAGSRTVEEEIAQLRTELDALERTYTRLDTSLTSVRERLDQSPENTALKIQDIIRDVLLLIFCVLSLQTTAKHIRDENHFHWGPMKEVAVVFAAIFITILPALAMLRAGANGQLAFITASAREPWHYFWITGLLSSFLDNAPTYLTFLTTALGNFFNGLPEQAAVARLLAEQPVILQAISAGAVFMGANTYKTDSGYQFSGSSSESNMSPGSVDLDGICGIAGIDRDKITSGVFDNARVYAFATTWNSPVEDEEEIGIAFFGRATIIDGARWSCEGAACTASGGTEQPATRACRRVVQKFGPVTAFTYKGTELSAEELAVCNA